MGSDRADEIRRKGRMENGNKNQYKNVLKSFQKVTNSIWRMSKIVSSRQKSLFIRLFRGEIRSRGIAEITSKHYEPS